MKDITTVATITDYVTRQKVDPENLIILVQIFFLCKDLLYIVLKLYAYFLTKTTNYYE